jgi:SAM-dependent methyltransferase
MPASAHSVALLAEASSVAPDGDGLYHWIRKDLLTASDNKEFASDAIFEQANADCSENQFIREDVLRKASFLKTFLLVPDRLGLSGNASVLEMGACNGWASALLKKNHPSCTVVATDLLAKALARSVHWERLFESRIDAKWACHCRQLPFADAQFDVVFTFASFHHFGIGNDFRGALKEMLRVVKPGGRIVLLYEPSCPPFLYKRAFAAVNRRREEEGVDEDLLVPSRLAKQVANLGAEARIEYFPEARFRDSPASTAYYFLLSRFPFLCRFAMCTVNVIIRRSAGL